MKINTLCIVFFISTLSAFSQNNKIKFELGLGTTLPIPKTSKLTKENLDGAPVVKTSLNIGAYILPSINYNINGKSSVDFGIGFYLDRFSLNEEIAATKEEGNRSVYQIQLPANYNFHLGKDRSYLLGVGAFTNIPLSVNEQGDYSINLNKFSPNIDIKMKPIGKYDREVKERYNPFSLGAFVQLKKKINLTSNLKGFLLLKINQYINSIKSVEKHPNDVYTNYKEKEPTTVNLGFGVTF